MTQHSPNDRNAHPLDTLIDFAWAAGADRFWVNNAKDELKKLRDQNDTSLAGPIGWARINKSGDFFELRTNSNPFVKNLVPMYVKKEDVEQALSSGGSYNQ